MDEVKIVAKEPVDKVKISGASIVGYEHPGLQVKETHSRRVPINSKLLCVESNQDFKCCTLEVHRELMYPWS